MIVRRGPGERAGATRQIRQPYLPGDRERAGGIARRLAADLGHHGFRPNQPGEQPLEGRGVEVAARTVRNRAPAQRTTVNRHDHGATTPHGKPAGAREGPGIPGDRRDQQAAGGAGRQISQHHSRWPRNAIPQQIVPGALPGVPADRACRVIAQCRAQYAMKGCDLSFVDHVRGGMRKIFGQGGVVKHALQHRLAFHLAQRLRDADGGCFGPIRPGSCADVIRRRSLAHRPSARAPRHRP